ncbi:MAG: ABC transporter permease [Sphaerobacter sp.]|nr:ABC transporter permease [Sphaerobacter sp.]
MASLGTLFSVELAKTIRRPMTWILVVILLGFIVLVYTSLILALVGGFEGNINVEGAEGTSLQDMILLPDGFGLGVSFAQSIGGILLAILAAGSFGSEFSWGTLRTMLLMRADRLRLLIAKLLVLLLAAVVVMLIGAAVGLFGSLVAGIALGEPLRTDQWLTIGFVGDAARMLLIGLVGATFWTLFAASLTVVTRSLAAGIGITMAAVFVGDFTTSLIARLGTLGEWVSRVFPNTAISALAALNTTPRPSYDATDWAWITANLVGYTALLLAIAVVRFRRMNMVSGSG